MNVEAELILQTANNLRWLEIEHDDPDLGRVAAKLLARLDASFEASELVARAEESVRTS